MSGVDWQFAGWVNLLGFNADNGRAPGIVQVEIKRKVVYICIFILPILSRLPGRPLPLAVQFCSPDSPLCFRCFDPYHASGHFARAGIFSNRGDGRNNKGPTIAVADRPICNTLFDLGNLPGDWYSRTPCVESHHGCTVMAAPGSLNCEAPHPSALSLIDCRLDKDFSQRE